MQNCLTSVTTIYWWNLELKVWLTCSLAYNGETYQKCPFCLQRFNNEKLLIKHVDKVHKNDKTCTVCGINNFKSMVQLEKHMNKIHQKSCLTKTFGNVIHQDGKIFRKCPYCAQCFNDYKVTLGNIISNTNGKIFSCKNMYSALWI